MKVGIRLPQTGEQAILENIINLAKEADEKGFDSLWVLERLLWPLSPHPGENFPPDWQEVLEPLELLTFVAAITKRIKLGTSVIDMFFHNPIILAKRFATLDLLSGGRAIAGLGIGWSKDEFLASNIPMEKRGKRADVDSAEIGDTIIFPPGIYCIDKVHLESGISFTSQDVSPNYPI